MWVAGHSLRDLRHLLRASSWQSSFLEAAWPPFFLGIAGCRGMPGATPLTLLSCSVRALCSCPTGKSWQELSGMTIRVAAVLQFLGEPISSQGVSCACTGL